MVFTISGEAGFKRRRQSAQIGVNMRKYIKSKCVETLDLLNEAHGEIIKYIGERESGKASALLEQCQDTAISLGTLIEDLEGRGHQSVAPLEEYCELIYCVHGKLAGGEAFSINKIHKSLKRQVIKMKNSIRNDIREQIEAVFLPYKASMWDSLESVWRAADSAPDCDAYVIPIPYYDKNPDGSLRRMHYEGSQYPPDVPIVRYDEFDFAAHRPDMIFIHNPYDNMNYVTSVPPFFYSENLKKYTDKLIYIPYFVLAEIEPDNGEAVANMSHFCTVPGVFHADRVIVQSEKMRKIYINVLAGVAGEESRKLWESKILGLGSPKFDRVANVAEEARQIPPGWLEIVRKPDGSRKKIILYNTSVSALLKHSEKMLEKMESVFRIFREQREEVSLLWRPHPLIQATIESMRPQLWEAYEKLKKRYVEEGWGIYDDSADLDRAIALSDAYYGDASSLVQLYRKTGKPIMMQNVDILY